MKKGVWKEEMIIVHKPVYRCPYCSYRTKDDGYPPYYCGYCGSRLYANEHEMTEGEENNEQ